MTVDWNKPVQLRDGRKVKIYTTDSRIPDYPVVGAYRLKTKERRWVADLWTQTGQNAMTNPKPSDWDIINKPPKVTYKYRKAFGSNIYGATYSVKPKLNPKPGYYLIVFKYVDGVFDSTTIEN